MPMRNQTYNWHGTRNYCHKDYFHRVDFKMSWSTDFGFDDLISPHGGGGGGSMSFDSGVGNTMPRNGNSSYGQGAPQTSVGTMTISELTLGIPGKQLSGVIIAKEDPRSFPNKKEPGTERHLLSFTIRDSPSDSVNVTCWGTKNFTHDLANRFHIGDVVELHQFIVQSKPTDGTDERFRPATPGPFQLSVSEGRASVQLYSGEDDLSALSHVPAKQSDDYYTISDVLTNGMQLHAMSINMMAVIKSVGPVRDLTTKLGKQLKRCEVKLFDETAPNFLLNLWNEELIALAQTWTPKDNVIFAADVRVTFDDYKKTMVATANSKTIITVNPDTREAHSLYRYAQTVELDMETTNDDMGGGGDYNRVDLESIQTVYTAKQVKDKVEPTADGGTEYGILYCHVSRFDIDSDTSVSITRCSKCRRRVVRGNLTCENQDCPQGSLTMSGDFSAQPETTTQYHIMMDLTDYTATLTSCLLTTEAAESMLQCPVTDFNMYEDDQKTKLKWEYLLEKCKVYVKMVLPTFDRPQSSIRILSCTRADLQEAAKYLQ